MAKTYYKYKDRKSAPIDYAGAAQGLSDSIQGTVDKLKGEADKAGAEAREAQLLAKQTAERQVKEAYARLDKERERARQDRKDAEARADKRELRSTTFYDKALEGLSEVDALGMATKGQANEYWQTNVVGLTGQVSGLALKLYQDYTSGRISRTQFITGKTQMLDQIRMLKITMDSSLQKINQTNERIAKGEASAIEPYMRKYNQEFQDWKKRKLMISPENYTIYAVGLSSDDPIDGLPEEPKYLSLTENLTGLQNQYDAYNLDAKTTAYAKLVEDITIDEGGVKITDPFQTGGGADLMASIKTKFGTGVSDTEKASILLPKEEYDIIQNVWTEEQYEEWKKTASKEEIRGGIWLKHESLEGGRVNAVLQENQKKAFLDDAINEIKIKAGYSKTVDTPKAVTAAEGRKMREMAGYGDAMHRFFMDEDKTEAATAIAGIIGDDFVDFNMSSDGKKGQLIVMVGGKPVYKDIVFSGNYEDFIKNNGGALLDSQEVAQYEAELIGGRGADEAPESASGGYKTPRALKLKTDVTMDQAISVVDSELDDDRYRWLTAVEDMEVAAEDMFKKLDLQKDKYKITPRGSVLEVKFLDLPAHDFDTEDPIFGDDHDTRREAFKDFMKKIYTEVTTGIPQGGTSGKQKVEW